MVGERVEEEGGERRVANERKQREEGGRGKGGGGRGLVERKRQSCPRSHWDFASFHNTEPGY